MMSSWSSMWMIQLELKRDRAWKFKRNFIEFHMFDSRSLNDDHAFHGIAKDWAWKFKRVERQGGPLE
ncbi:hypothetical protein LguiA_021800 [Lonicera macranthoides]